MKLSQVLVNFSLACDDPGWVSGVQRSPGIEKSFWAENDKVVYACEPPSFGHNGGYTQAVCEKGRWRGLVPSTGGQVCVKSEKLDALGFMKIDIGSQLWKQKYRSNFKQAFLERIKEERVRKRILARKSPKKEMTNLLVRRNQFVKPIEIEEKNEDESQDAELEVFEEEIEFFTEEIKKSKSILIQNYLKMKFK